MNTDTIEHSGQHTDSPTARRLNLWGSGLMIAISLLHIAVFVPHPYWSEWLRGDLRAGEGSTESVTVFWALPGGFAPVMLLLGMVLFGSARSGRPLPRYVGWGLGLWVLLCVSLIGVSGFLLGTIPTLLLIIAGFLRPRRLAR